MEKTNQDLVTFLAVIPLKKKIEIEKSNAAILTGDTPNQWFIFFYYLVRCIDKQGTS